MSSRRRRDPAEVYRQTTARSDRYQQFLNYLQARNLPRNEESVQSYVFSLGLGVNERVNLEHELTERIRQHNLFNHHDSTE